MTVEKPIATKRTSYFIQLFFSLFYRFLFFLYSYKIDDLFSFRFLRFASDQLKLHDCEFQLNSFNSRRKANFSWSGFSNLTVIIIFRLMLLSLSFIQQESTFVWDMICISTCRKLKLPNDNGADVWKDEVS